MSQFDDFFMSNYYVQNSSNFGEFLKIKVCVQTVLPDAQTGQLDKNWRKISKLKQKRMLPDKNWCKMPKGDTNN